MSQNSKMRRNVRISDVTGVTQGGTALIKPLVGPRYTAINILCYVNGVLTDVNTVASRVRINVNSKEIWNVSVARLLKRWAVDNPAAATGRLPLAFASAARADKVDELFTCFDTAGEQDFTIQVDLKELADPDDVIRLRVTASYDKSAFIVNGARSKQHLKLQEVSDALVNGAVDITKIPISNPIQRIFFDTTAAISLVEIDADGERAHELNKVENDQTISDYGLDGSQFAYIYAADFSEQILDHLVVKSTLNVRVTAGGSAPVACLVETLSPGFVRS